MELNLSAELRNKLARIARGRGVSTEGLIREAIERLVHDDWFVREVEKGLAQIESNDTLTHEELGARLEKHLLR